MDTVVVTINTVVMAGVGFALWWVFRGRFGALESRFGALESRMDRLEDRVDRRIDRLEASIEGMRSDVTAVALAVGARPRAQGRGR